MKEHLTNLGVGLLFILIIAAIIGVFLTLIYAVTLYPTHFLSITLYTVIVLLLAYGVGAASLFDK